jgi:DNA-binding CsgD family transcriptional regulator
MAYRDDECPKSRIQTLMDVAASLAHFTHRAEGFAQIPAYLSRVFRLPCLSLAIINTSQKDPTVLLSAQFATSAPTLLDQAMINVHQKTLPHLAHDGPAPRINVDVAEPDVAAGGAFEGYPRATVFAHLIDPEHRMLLVVHQRSGEQALPVPLAETLQIVAEQLGRLLETLVIWLEYPETLGGSSQRLTDREWMVLRFLDSEAGEKQLADQLGLSPHTLHSHIKAIYRKVGVQGRLPLLLRVEHALQVLRLSRLEAVPANAAAPSTDRNANAA